MTRGPGRLDGIYMAVDAIPDAFLVLKGPRRPFSEAETQFRHNLHCRLIPAPGRPAVISSHSHPSREGTVPQGGTISAKASAEVLLAGTRPAKLVCPIPAAATGDGWLEGYGRTCEALARRIPLAAGKARPGTVAVVGYLFDRDEPDHAANLKELRRMLAGLGLRLVSVWLSGRGVAALRKVEGASVILSFPYARSAARILGRRLGAKVVRADLPLGLTGTERSLKSVASALGRGVLARRFLGREVPAAVADTQAHVLRIISGRSASLALSDPHLRAALRGLCADLGVKVLEDRADAVQPGGRASPAPSGKVWAQADADGPVLLVGSRGPGDLAPSRQEGIVIPLGYPNFEDHPAVDRPFLGFSGFRGLVELFAGRILLHEAKADRPVEESWRKGARPPEARPFSTRRSGARRKGAVQVGDRATR
ncbi:MAG: hypothetical protein HY748_15500 [Elusimicrobia bacterium]|nr:hypothetical protein [Elusimicrobiota bacterium]